MRKKLCIFIILTVLLISVCAQLSLGEGLSLDMLLTGESSVPFTVCFSSPSYSNLAQFGQDRTDSLNRLLKHISVEISTDGPVSASTILIDQTPLYTVTELDSRLRNRKVYSFDPETIYENSEDDAGNSFAVPFLDQHFFTLNRMLDSMYTVFEKIPVAFSDLTRKSTENLNYREYGKAVRKVTVSFSADFVRTHFPNDLAALADDEESRQFLEHIVFSGSQKVVLLYDQKDRILRINYDGTAGLSSDSLRRVSVNWKCLRNEKRKKDNIALKSPAQKGNDRYNLSYSRDLNDADGMKKELSWEYSLDFKSGDSRKKIKYTAALTDSDGTISGNVVLDEKLDDDDVSFTLVPRLKKEKEQEYKGTLEITNKKGKIITSNIVSGLRVFTCAPLTAPFALTATDTDLESEKAVSSSDVSADKLYGIIIRGLMSLPAHDIDFIAGDIPGEEWDSIIQLLN